MWNHGGAVRGDPVILDRLCGVAACSSAMRQVRKMHPACGLVAIQRTLKFLRAFSMIDRFRSLWQPRFYALNWGANYS